MAVRRKRKVVKSKKAQARRVKVRFNSRRSDPNPEYHRELDEDFAHDHNYGWGRD